MESNTKSAFAENYLFETSDSIVYTKEVNLEGIRLLDQKSNCKAIMRGDRQNRTRSPCTPVTHLLSQNSPLSKMVDYYKREAWTLSTSTLISTEEAHFHGGGSFLRRKLISTEEAHFYGGGSFLRRRLISTEEAHFYRGGWFLRRKLISTEEAHFYGGGSFLRRKLISTEEADFHWGGQFLSNRLIFVWKTRTIAQRKQGFNPVRACFSVCSSGTSGPPYKPLIRWISIITIRADVLLIITRKISARIIC